MKPKSVKLLVEAIDTCLYGPGGDPTWDNLLPAAQMIEVLIIEGHKKEITKGWITHLTVENLYNQNFLEHLGYSQILETY
jgi:hypothetical protein